MVNRFYGKDDFLKDIKGLKPQFYIAASYTPLSEIKGVTAAGLEGFTSYTPALDFEFLYHGYPLSMPNIAVMPEGPPSPVIISKAIKNLLGYQGYFVDVGVKVKPQTPHISITDSEPQELYEAGKRYAKEIESQDRLFMLSECVPAGTTTAYGLFKALGYECDGLFASSKDDKETNSLKATLINEAYEKFKEKIESPFSAVKYMGDSMQPFVAGLACGLSKASKVVLCGGTQMASVLALIKALPNETNYQNISLWTTKWIVNDAKSNITRLLELIDVPATAYYADFDFSDSKYKNLRLYDRGLVKEGVGAGALLSLAYLNGLSKHEILKEIENIYAKIAG